MLMERYWRGFISALWVCLLSACAELEEKPVLSSVADLPPSVSPQVLAQQRQQERQQQKRQQIRVLLASAQRALADDRLMVPKEGSAYSEYKKVLAVDQSSAEAHWGMQQITTRYLQLAEQAYQSRRDYTAEQLLQRAEMVAASPAETEVIRQRYQRVAQDNEILLPLRALSAHSVQMQKQLARVAQQVKAKQSRLLIVARNDAEGRWVYKQMRLAVAGYRLRGNIEVGQVPRIVLLDAH